MLTDVQLNLLTRWKKTKRRVQLKERVKGWVRIGNSHKPVSRSVRRVTGKVLRYKKGERERVLRKAILKLIWENNERQSMLSEKRVTKIG